MKFLRVFLTACSFLSGAASTSQTFRSSGEINISSCPIHFYGQRYEKAYVDFSADGFALCFKASYGQGIDNDCILMSGKCVNVIPLKDSNMSQVQQVELGNFGAQSILGIRTYSGYNDDSVEADALVNGLWVSRQTFQASETNRGVITDMSGCRLSGSVYLTNTTIQDPSTCSTITCDANGVATAVSDCGPTERCRGDGSCALNFVCSVTGSTIIDFSGRLNSVPDRCGYSLLSSPSLPGLQVMGVLKERRRRDMSFLDQVILSLDGNLISLEQGGRVKLDGRDLLLNSDPQLFHGVELSKDQADVKAKITASNFTVTVVFDGSTATIHLTGPNGATFQGLCEDSATTLSQVRVSQYSAADCNTIYADAADNSINCTNTAQWCGVLQTTPFDTCNSNIDPQPFISACSETLCKYPSQDGLECQFLEAYAEACRLHSTFSMDFLFAAGVQRAACQSCSSHEFCGLDTHSQKLRCHCRAIFASKYKPTGSFANDSQIIYKTAIMTKSAKSGCDVRHEKLHVRLLLLPANQSSVIQHVSSGEWSYNLTMKAFTDSDLTTQLDERSELDLNQQICVELKTEGLDGNAVSVVTDSCWATDQPSPTGNLRYDLVKNGCPNPIDETVKVTGNGQGTSNHFCFNTFQFSGRNSEVFLHCRVELCIKQGDNCVQRCSLGRRRRRSALPRYEDRNPALISVAWMF
ncbi:Pancreatic secretory granule membrane major glycoprotein GP2 [Oryzias melastigma]|uniref:Pancreatic secretory granule membrane major glycoprotein GP2 n=1 Tax=Oryzias melastigma TaxID=30732 RepID=A0A834F771_ORYME|nr:Pancreatic secretory granule membrane major glycoprotein GP2 [Oryzias melastigma]